MIPVGSATCQVMIDVSGTPFGGGPTWTDITDYVMTSPQEDGSSEITFSWGRQDWMGDATDSQFALTLRNIDGRFTPGRSVLADGVTANPFYPYITYGTRVRITETIASIVVYMADGYITDVTANPRTGLYWTVQVNCTDILASRMGATTPLRGWLTEEMMSDSPACLYPLQEAEGSATFGDITGKLGSATVVDSKFGTGVVTAGQESGNGLLSSTVTQITNASSATWTAGYTSPLSVVHTPSITLPGVAVTVEAWVNPTTIPPANSESPLRFAPGAGVTGQYIGFDITASGGVSAPFYVSGSTGLTLSAFVSATVPDIFDGNAHHLVATSDGATTLTLYVDGVSVGTNPVTVVPPSGTSGALTLGADPYGGFGGYQRPYTGGVAYAAVYPTALSASRVLAHYNAGVNGFTGERTDSRVVRVLSYRPNTGWNVDTGLGLVGSGDITDSTEQAALLDAASAEGGLLYVDGQGQITLLNRAHNFNPAATVTLNCANGEVDIPTTFNDDIQHVTNDVTVSRTDGASQRLTNQTSIDQVGVVAREMSANVDSDIHALDLAGWVLAQGVRDQTSIPTLAINLYTLASTAQALAVLQLKPLDVVTVTNIPGVPPSSTMTVQVQGGTYTRSSERFDIELYCTPTPTPVGVWDSGPAWWNSTSVVWAY